MWDENLISPRTSKNAVRVCNHFKNQCGMKGGEDAAQTQTDMCNTIKNQ